MRRRLGMAVAAMVVLAASACAAGDGGSRASVAEGWRRLAAGPLSPRVGHSAVWTGSELLIWGGTTGQECEDSCPRADGLAYRPGLRP